MVEAKKEALEQKLEAAKLYHELKKLQPVMEELRKKNVGAIGLVSAALNLSACDLQNQSTAFLKVGRTRKAISRN